MFITKFNLQFSSILFLRLVFWFLSFFFTIRKSYWDD